MENVKGIATKNANGTSNLGTIIKKANSMGYYVCHPILSATDYGCPSRRDRYYIFGVKTCNKDDKLDQLVKDFKEPTWAIRVTQVLDSLKGVEGALSCGI